MKIISGAYQEIVRAANEYEAEVKEAVRQGFLTEQTARTYLLHTNNFVKWCKNEFVPGSRNKK